MSPRKERYRTPEWQVHQIRQKRKQMLYGPYNCPKCNSEKLKIQIVRDKGKVVAQCECGLTRSFKYSSAYEPIDYFSRLADEYKEI